MSLSPSELHQLLSNAMGLPADDNIAESLGSIACSHEMSSRFVESLLAHHSVSENVDANAVNDCMRTLERIANNYEPFACTIMAYLWPYANELQLHEICDAIDLWLINCMSPDLRTSLMRLAASYSDFGVRRHFEELANRQ